MSPPSPKIPRGVVIHGGVGTLSPAELTPELDAAYRATLAESLEAGNEALASGGSAVDAVCAAVRIMEDSPLFNAGRGSNLDERGVVSMDASIMDGSTLGAGAVADVTDVRYPIDLARLVMERSENVMLCGPGAEAFARAQGMESTDQAFFVTERRLAALERAREAVGARPNTIRGFGPVGDVDPTDFTDPRNRAGTVGAVARDAGGRLAAATSTGGMANKPRGRVGDSPIIGAGTYAGRLCAVSCTGWGEYFIRHAVAHDVHARMAHGGATLRDAVRGIIHGSLEAHVPGAGGLVAIDYEGNAVLSFNTGGMYRGWMELDGEPVVDIYGEG